MWLVAGVMRFACVPVIMSLSIFPGPSHPHHPSVLHPSPLLHPILTYKVVLKKDLTNAETREKKEEMTTMKHDDYDDHEKDYDYNGTYEEDDYDWKAAQDYNGNYEDDDYDWKKAEDYSGNYDYNGNDDHNRNYDYNGNYDYNNEEVTTEVINEDKQTGNQSTDYCVRPEDCKGQIFDGQWVCRNNKCEVKAFCLYGDCKSAITSGVRLSNGDFDLDYDTVVALSSLPQHCIYTEYPNKLQQVLGDGEDLKSPSELHPVFYGCFDWHSSVHGHWLLSRALSLFPSTELANNVTNIFTDQFTEDKVTRELTYFSGPGGDSFERTYGWAWLLKLQEELVKDARIEKHSPTEWHSSLLVLSEHISNSYKKFLPKLVYPIRVGEHTNTAFGLSLALDYARTLNDMDLINLIIHNATGFYREDRNCPLNWEPSGYDFLSPCLQEADLMSRVIQDDEEFSIWLTQFLPQLFDPDFVLEPGQVLDRTDGKLVHLDGLNFSRAWCLYSIGGRIGGETGARLVAMGDNHVDTSRDAVVGSNYMGSHWLATFLLYALEKRKEAFLVI